MAKRAPQRFASYRETHEAIMANLRDGGFVESDDLEFRPQGHGYILLDGIVCCQGGIMVDVSKQLHILDGEGANAMVESVLYCYCVTLQGEGVIFRYCSPHDHRPYHHVHRSDLRGGTAGITQVDVLGGKNYPTLGEVVEEAQDWYAERAEQLHTRGPAISGRRRQGKGQASG